MKAATNPAKTGKLRMLGPILLFLVWNPSPADEPAAWSSRDSAECELRIAGRSVESVTLVRLTGGAERFRCTEKSIRLPAGQYRVEEVNLKGGFRHSGRLSQAWGTFSLTPEEPYELEVGAPLIPTVSVNRRGAVLRLDYHLRDASGREYKASNFTALSLPQFIAYKGQREVGSGTFEYG